MKILKKITMITMSAAIAGLASAALAVNASADEFAPDEVIAFDESAAAPEADNVPEISDEPEAISDMDYIPEVSDEAAVALNGDYSSDELTDIHDKAISEINSVTGYETCYSIDVSEEQLNERSINMIATGVYWNGSSFIEVTSNDELILYMVNTKGYNNVCGVTTIFSADTEDTTFTAKFYQGEWYYYDSKGNIIRPTTTDPLYVTGSHSDNTITVNGKKYTKA